MKNEGSKNYAGICIGGRLCRRETQTRFLKALDYIDRKLQSNDTHNRVPERFRKIVQNAIIRNRAISKATAQSDIDSCTACPLRANNKPEGAPQTKKKRKELPSKRQKNRLNRRR